jgi:hypothetical protein
VLIMLNLVMVAPSMHNTLLVKQKLKVYTARFTIIKFSKQMQE